MADKKMKKGFTLIEIVIVLAIAALIMVVVFLAVQGAQRAQRDNFRKDVVNRAAAAVQAYKGNNNGNNPTAPANIANYVPNSSSQGITIAFPAGNAAQTCPASASGSQNAWLTTAGGVVAVNVCLESSTAAYSRNSQ